MFGRSQSLPGADSLLAKPIDKQHTDTVVNFLIRVACQVLDYLVTLHNVVSDRWVKKKQIRPKSSSVTFLPGPTDFMAGQYFWNLLLCVLKLVWCRNQSQGGQHGDVRLIPVYGRLRQKLAVSLRPFWAIYYNESLSQNIKKKSKIFLLSLIIMCLN